MWTDEIEASLAQTLAAGGVQHDLAVEYLDTARIVGKRELAAHMARMRELLRAKYSKTRFDAVVVSDNAALDFMLDDGGTLVSGAPLVFCGVNSFSPKMLRGRTDATGVAETPSFAATLGLALKLRPQARKVLVLAEDTPTGVANLGLFKEQAASFADRLSFEVIAQTDIHALEERLRGLTEDWIVLPMVRPTDGYGVLGAADASRRISAASPVPVFAAWDFWMGHGPVAGFVVSAKAQGRAAADMVVRILKGEPASSIGVAYQENNIVMADQKALARFGLDMDALPHGAKVINVPASYYAVNKAVVWAVALGACVLVLFSILLGLSIVRRKRAEVALHRLTQILEHSDSIAVFKDPSLRYVATNQAYLRLTGRAGMSGLVGKTDAELFRGLATDRQIAEYMDNDRRALALPPGGILTIEETMAGENGADRIFLTKKFPVYEQDGNTLMGVATLTNEITEAKRAQEVLRRSEQRFRSLFEEMTNGFSLHEVICDEQGHPVDYRFLEVNPAFERLTGLSAESLIGRTVLEVMPNTERVWIERYGQVALFGEPMEFEEYSSELGRWYEVKAFCTAPGQFAVISKDTTTRKMAQLRLAESEERFRMLASESPVSIVSFDAEGTVTFVSRWHLAEFAKNLLDEDFFLGRKAWELPSIISAGLAGDVRAILDGTILNRLEVHVPSNCIGEEAYQNMRGVPFWQDDAIIGGVLIRENITERKRAEEALIRSRTALEESRANLVLALEMASMANWELDLDTMVFTFNEQFYALYATTPQREGGLLMAAEKYAGEFVHPDEGDIVDKEVHRIFGGEYDNRPAQIEHRIVRRDGAVRDILVRFLVSWDHDGRRRKAIGVNQDITERKLAREVLRINEERLRLAMEATSDGLWDWNLKTGEVYWSPRAFTMLGYEPDEFSVSFEVWQDLLHPDERGDVTKSVLHQVQQGGGFQAEFRFRNKQDGYQWFIGRGKVVETDESGATRRMVGTHVDITARKLAERELEQIFLMSPDMICIADIERARFLKVNPAFSATLGYSEEELLSRPFVEYVHPEDVEATRRVLAQEISAGGLVLNFENRYRHRDGGYRWLRWVSRSVPSEGILYGVAHDITERREFEQTLRQSESALRAIIENNPIGMHLYDLCDDRLVFSGANPAADTILGLRHAEFVGKDMLAVFPMLGETDIPNLYRQVLETGEPWHSEQVGYEDERAAGAYEVLCFRVSPTRVAVAFMDITMRKQAEEDMRRARDMAEEADKAKSEFLANMSHEIRTPLNGMLGMLQLLQTENSPEEQADYIKMAYDSGTRLLSLLNDILDFCKLEDGMVNLCAKPFSPASIEASVRDLFHVAAHDKGLDLDIRMDSGMQASLLGDFARIQQIVFNVVGNAIKFTQAGRVTLEGWTGPELKPGRVWLYYAISDTGSGIPDNVILKVLERFTQVDASYTRKHEGAGLGLAIVKRIIQAMGGGICISSELGVGTTIFLRMPLQVDSQGRKNDEAGLLPGVVPAAGSVAGMRVLLVEDEPISQMAMLVQLERAGLRAVAVSDGQEALDLLAGEAFDCVLMDIQMPRLDGMETTRLLRTSPEFAHCAALPVIALTAYALPGDKERFLQHGMDDYLSKPVQFDRLISVIARAVSQKPSPN